MIVTEYSGIVREVVDAVNLAFSEGDASIVQHVELTRAEMDEFMANNPFVGNTGKFYGDDDRGSLLEVLTNNNGKVSSFRLNGVLFFAPV